jgi:hypothetical protein
MKFNALGAAINMLKLTVLKYQRRKGVPRPAGSSLASGSGTSQRFYCIRHRPAGIL